MRDYGRFVDFLFLLFTLAATGLHVFALTSPNWWILDEDDGRQESHYGIWVTRICVNVTCKTSESDRTDGRAWLQGVVVVETLAGVLLVMASITQTVILLRGKKGPLLRKLYVLMIGGAGGVIVVGIFIFVKKKAGLVINQASLRTKDGTIGLALIFSSVGAAISLVLAVVMGISLLTVFSEPKDYEAEEANAKYWADKHKQLNDLKSAEQQPNMKVAHSGMTSSL